MLAKRVPALRLILFCRSLRRGTFVRAKVPKARWDDCDASQTLHALSATQGDFGPPGRSAKPPGDEGRATQSRYLEKAGDSIKNLLTFLAGGVGYCALETLWRGRTHPSMALCGGTVLVIFRKMVQKGGSVLSLCIKGGALITGCELLCGLVFNRDKSVWDYSRLPGNFRGQICPLFSGLWCLLCWPLTALCPVLDRHLSALDKPR